MSKVAPKHGSDMYRKKSGDDIKRRQARLAQLVRAWC